jgi:hypothetical protein
MLTRLRRVLRNASNRPDKAYTTLTDEKLADVAAQLAALSIIPSAPTPAPITLPVDITRQLPRFCDASTLTKLVRSDKQLGNIAKAELYRYINLSDTLRSPNSRALRQYLHHEITPAYYPAMALLESLDRQAESPPIVQVLDLEIVTDHDALIRVNDLLLTQLQQHLVDLRLTFIYEYKPEYLKGDPVVLADRILFKAYPVLTRLELFNTDGGNLMPLVERLRHIPLLHTLVIHNTLRATRSPTFSSQRISLPTIRFCTSRQRAPNVLYRLRHC